MNVGIIACQDYWKKGCPGYNSHFLCFLALEKSKGPLGQLSGSKIVSMQPCPGCPGTGRLELARQMLNKEKIDCFVFPSCVFFNEHCPTALTHAAAIEAELGRPVLLGSYLEAKAAHSRATVILKPHNIPSLVECWKHLLALNYLHYLLKNRPLRSREVP